MFEYELDSDAAEEEKKEYDYDYSKEEFFNPIVVKGPDGTISIGTESRNKDTKEALCWSCNAHLIYKMNEEKVKCYQCKAQNSMGINNTPPDTIIKCPNKNCE
jgi:hypothetical protein